MMGMEAAGAAPIVNGAPVAKPETIASAIRIGNPANWAGALAARDESGGAIDVVTDEEIIEAYGLMARREGIFCEPASAASVAGLIKQARVGTDFSSSTVVCIITGNGLKDPADRGDAHEPCAGDRGPDPRGRRAPVGGRLNDGRRLKTDEA